MVTVAAQETWLAEKTFPGNRTRWHRAWPGRPGVGPDRHASCRQLLARHRRGGRSGAGNRERVGVPEFGNLVAAWSGAQKAADQRTEPATQFHQRSRLRPFHPISEEYRRTLDFTGMSAAMGQVRLRGTPTAGRPGRTVADADQSE